MACSCLIQQRSLAHPSWTDRAGNNYRIVHTGVCAQAEALRKVVKAYRQEVHAGMCVAGSETHDARCAELGMLLARCQEPPI